MQNTYSNVLEKVAFFLRKPKKTTKEKSWMKRDDRSDNPKENANHVEITERKHCSS